MKTMASHVKNVAKCLLFLGFCVQIGLGLIWTFQNIGERPMFAPMQLGILSEYYGFIYVVQLCCAFLSYYAFLKVVRRNEDAGWCYVFGAFVLLTVPSGLQCHLALLPYSFMSTALVVWFTLMIRWLRKRHTCLQYIFGVLLSIIVVHALCMMPVRTGVETAVSKEEPILVSMTSRVVWPFLQEDYYRMPSDVLKWIDKDMVIGTTIYADGIANSMYPMSVERYGAEQAKSACLGMIRYELDVNARGVLKNIAQDYVSYHAPAVANYLQLAGYGYGSMASKNYTCLSTYSGVFARIWVVFWAVSFVWLVAATVTIWIFEKRKVLWRILIMIGVPMEYAICLFTMQGSGLMDYKKILPVTLMTYSVMLSAMLCKPQE